jgi:aprataxin
MSPKKPIEKPPKRLLVGDWRSGLGQYISHPEKYLIDRVLYFDDNFVAIRDGFEKSVIHTLLLPRDQTKVLLHPFEAFKDPVFLASVQQAVTKLKENVADALRGRYGHLSVSDKPRQEALDGAEVLDELPRGRDWAKDIISGIHAHPSMSHLHIHVLSKDMNGLCMKKRSHYNSFVTPFLIPVEDFPLDEKDETFYYGRAEFLDADLKCWRCGKNFGNQFKKLKDHLEEEFERWIRE